MVQITRYSLKSKRCLSIRRVIIVIGALLASVFLTISNKLLRMMLTNTEPQTKHACMMRIQGSCSHEKSLSNLGWFEDSDKGGPPASTREACIARWKRWKKGCKNVEMFFDDNSALFLRNQVRCRFQIDGICDNFPELSRSNDSNKANWFDDSEKGGPMASTWWQCSKRQLDWQKKCGPKTIVNMDFEGPGKPSEIQSDGSWNILDKDGAVLTLKRNSTMQKSNHRSCYTVTRSPTFPNQFEPTEFCYPSINIAGHPLAGTGFLSNVLLEHPQVQPVFPWMKYCRTVISSFTYFRYFMELAVSTSQSMDNAITVNGCIMPDEVIEMDYLLQHPEKSLTVYLVRDIVEQSWAAYNLWCDPTHESNCDYARGAISGIHDRSPRLFHNAINEKALDDSIPPKEIIPNSYNVQNLYTSWIEKLEQHTVTRKVHVIASEKMKANLTGVWDNLVAELSSRSGFVLSGRPKINERAEISINAGDYRGEDHRQLPEKGGLYAQSRYQPIFNETADLLRFWWEECKIISHRTDWPYDCYTTGYDKFRQFRNQQGDAPMEDVYITLWLHQFHPWFAAEEGKSTQDKARKYLQDAKESGFTSVMGDLPWAWTEREARGDIRIDSFGKDWMAVACELGLSLHVVLSMREFPPWVNATSFFEIVSEGLRCPGNRQTSGPSISHPDVWEMVQSYVGNTTKLLLEKYGSCIRSVSPTLNNEFETRYTQTHDAMRDYSNSSQTLYREWQVRKGLVATLEDAVNAPNTGCRTQCDPILQKDVWQWLGYREEFLAERYIQLCEIVHSRALHDGQKIIDPNCLLHMGEMFATTDYLNSNLFFKLAKSKSVNEVVMDSNMALLGAPASPSIVGILVSTASSYGKIVHYEAATERILPCDNHGNLIREPSSDVNKGTTLLLRSGIQNALQAGAHSIGITNLCAPKKIQLVFSIDSPDNGPRSSLYLRRVSTFQPTAIIFVPYRVFYSWSFVISGLFCGAEPIRCWHSSFDQIPIYGKATLVPRQAGMCTADVAQRGLINAWDELRQRHAQVAVVGDVGELNNDLLNSAKELLLLQYPCVMEDDKWHFYEGDQAFQAYKKRAMHHKFEERMIEMPGKCRNSADTN